MSAKVFISYRRDDSAGHAGRVHDRLAHEFGSDLLFMDVDSIPLGSDFIKVLRDEVAKCDALLAVIGHHWLDARDAGGERRLDSETDFVRIEIATALQRDIPVIPILLDGAKIPQAEQLPADLQGLAARNGLDVRHSSFHVDMDRLIGGLKARAQGARAVADTPATRPEAAPNDKRRAPALLAGFVLLACAGAGMLWFAMTPRPSAPPVPSTSNQQTAPTQPAPIAPPPAPGPSTAGPPQLSTAPSPAAPSAPPVPQPPAPASVPAPVLAPAPVVAPAPASPPVVAPAPAPGKLSPVKTELLRPADEHAVQANDSFKECAVCPVMTVIAPGAFTMGSPTTELGRAGSENPQHLVTIGHKFAFGRFSVTFDEWDACVADGGCGGYSPADQGWGRGKRPVVNVSWNQAQAYLAWLSHKTGRTYRLPTEAEREYAARAGTTTPFWWGSSITTDEANYNGSYTYGDDGVHGETRGQSVPVDSFLPNPWGLFQMHGNVSEWTQDCWHDNYYADPPTDGSAWIFPDCPLRVRRGGSIGSPPQVLRSAARLSGPQAKGQPFIGFRVVRPLAD
jgi:formylglycine-generating enzyme required for sulfatase activity